MRRLLNENRLTKRHKFHVGDVVEVRSKEEISKGLDSANKLDGCLMMKQMWDYCSRRFRVLKVVENLFVEYRYKMFRSRAPLYILDGLICNGAIDESELRCDRSCYLLWHEKWLESP